VYFHSRLLEKWSELQADFVTSFRDTGGYQKAGLLEGFSQFVSDFIEASRTIEHFLHKITVTNFENQVRPFKKNCIFRFLGS
jgi:hypothetical protein